jgi:hypothetical protein
LACSLQTDRSSPGGPADTITYLLPATGDYTIVVGGARGDSSPTYTFWIN